MLEYAEISEKIMTEITLPVLALRDVVLFPGMIAPLFIGRLSSLEALGASRQLGSMEHILLTTQKKHELDEPKA